MRIEIPELAVVALVGPSGSGKTTFCNKYFKATEVLSSDYFRGMLSDDENNQEVSKDAFEALYYMADKRLSRGLLTVIDATNLQKEDRTKVLELAKRQNCHAAAIVMDIPEETCLERNELRTDRTIKDSVVKKHIQRLKRTKKYLKKEGFRFINYVKPEDFDEIEMIRKPLWNNRKEEHGPFDMIGDIHGCFEELCELLEKMDYQVDREQLSAVHPEGRKLVFLGDLCDRGPENAKVLKFVMNVVNSENGYCLLGNHDRKLLRWLRGSEIKQTHGIDRTIAQIEAESPEFKEEVKQFLASLISHYVFDCGNLVAAHAGLKEEYHGRASSRVKMFALYGDTTGETDEYGLPVRQKWANEYRGSAVVVFGHTPSATVEIINNTYCIDTGCVFGGALTAFRYPEHQCNSVKAKEEYYEPIKPLDDSLAQDDDVLKVEDVTGKKYISTRLRPNIKILEENNMAALEIMSRFAADPRWLIYLPPTMSPCETSHIPEYLEHPKEAFDYFAKAGVEKVICEQKHMGSRAVVVLCKDQKAAESRFGVTDGSTGIIYTRTGRRFFDDPDLERSMLERLSQVLERTNFFEDFDTDWVCLDTELMPWSAKARKLIEEQYAPVGRSGRDGLDRVIECIQKGARRQKDGEIIASEGSQKEDDLLCLLKSVQMKRKSLERYTDAYRQYCWTVNSLDDYRMAPFHILATEGKVWSDQTHHWHMETIRKYMTGFDPVFMMTNYVEVDTGDEESINSAIEWWLELTGNGGEGMVVKPYQFISGQQGRLIQPAVKCRGKEYLRIIYGPEYTLGDHLQRLKKRSLSKKRNLALQEFSLGMESLERFVRKEPLYKVHECTFAVLALESEPVDPRL